MQWSKTATTPLGVYNLSSPTYNQTDSSQYFLQLRVFILLFVPDSEYRAAWIQGVRASSSAYE